MLDTVDGILNVIENNAILRGSQESQEKKIVHMSMRSEFIDELYCTICGANRKHNVKLLNTNKDLNIEDPEHRFKFGSVPVVHIATCLQCETKTNLILYYGPNNLELAILRSAYGGSSTNNTPQEVKYYLDQAYRARMVSALSAAMSMYRSALEWILFDQGYKNGMLGAKIKKIEEDIKNNVAPKWANEMPMELLSAIKNIGNGAMHTNDGDIRKQEEIDKNVIEIVDVVFAELLDVIYEQPIRRQQNVEKLKVIANTFKK